MTQHVLLVLTFLGSLFLYAYLLSRSADRKPALRPRQRRAGVFLKAICAAPQTLDPGSCDAQRIAEILMMQSKAEAVPVTPEWRAEQEAKRAAYAKSRREWHNLCNEPGE